VGDGAFGFPCMGGLSRGSGQKRDETYCAFIRLLAALLHCCVAELRLWRVVLLMFILLLGGVVGWLQCVLSHVCAQQRVVHDLLPCMQVIWGG